MSTGPSPEPADALRALLEEGRAGERFTAAAAAAGTPTDVEFASATGTLSPSVDREVTTATRFDVASLAKPIVTTTLALQLVEAGVLTLTDTLGSHLSALKETDRADVTVAELLTHSSGMQPYAYSETWHDREEALADLATRQLVRERDSGRFVYSCLNYVYLSALIRRVTGEPIATLAPARVFEPARMDNAVIGPCSGETTVATYGHEYRERELRGEIHDPIADVMGGESGNAGLFASLEDVAAFAQTLLGDARGEGTLLHEHTVELLPVVRSRLERQHQGYGWRVGTDLIPAPQWSERSIGHTGFTGTSLWIDLERERFAVLLTNAEYHGAELYRYRQRFHALCAQL